MPPTAVIEAMIKLFFNDKRKIGSLRRSRQCARVNGELMLKKP